MRNFKVIMSMLATVLLTFSLLSMSVFAEASNAESAGSSIHGISLKNKTPVYSKKDTKSKVLKNYSQGAVLKFKKLNSTWYQATVIMKGKATTGYINHGDVDIPTTSPKTVHGIAVKNPTKVYSAATTHSKTLKTYKQGSDLKYQTYISGWYRATIIVKGKKKTAYIHKTDVEVPTTSPKTVHGIAAKKPTRVHSAATTHSKTLKTYKQGSDLKYQTYISGWYRATIIVKGKKKTAYIHKTDVEVPTTSPKTLNGVAVKSPTKVYSKTLTSSKVIKSYAAGSKLKYKTYTSNWYKVTVFINGKKKTGYIKKGDVRKMTLSEKVGQMVTVGISGKHAGSDASTLIKDYHAGGIILFGDNIQSAAQTTQLNNELKTMNAKAHNPLPLLISVDQEGGSVQRMPDSIAGTPSQENIGKKNSVQYSKKIGQVLGEELNAFGFNMDFAPVLDVVSDPGKSVIGDRSFSSNKQVVSNLGTATMNGLQSKNVISAVKHFPGYGEATSDAHKVLPSRNVGLKHLENVDWVPYKKAIANGADTVMVTHIMLPKLDTKYPASMSQKIITGQLRNKLGFHGVVITDSMSMGAITKNYGNDKAAVQAVKAGADIVLINASKQKEISTFKAIEHAVKTGKISKNQIDQSVKRIIDLKSKYHLSNAKTKNVNVKQLNQKINSVVR